ncbi:2-hydroxyacyl-CoA dehydratase [Chloroflexota bacterium]
MDKYMEKFEDWYETRHYYAKEWKKRTGGKVVGMLCTYQPEELFYAADILPVRIFGGHEAPTQAEPYMYSGLQCPHCRCCLSEGLKGKYDYLDGIIVSNACLTERPLFYAWIQHIGIEWHHYFMMPHATQTTGIYKFLRKELEPLKESIEKWIGRTITDEDIDRGIEIMNTNRSLMRQVWEYRKMADPPLTGFEALNISLSEQIVDKREHSEALRELLKELPQRKLKRETGTRLMLIGSETEDLEFVEMVEGKMVLPATVVIDEICTGTRYFWNNVVPQEDRLMAIAARYIDRVACPGKDWPKRKRFDHALNLCKEYNVEGAIVFQQKYCEPHELDIPDLRKFLEDNGIPSYFLEFDVTVPIGQFHTRVEAFVETLVDLF